jgi:hypothetical protein
MIIGGAPLNCCSCGHGSGLSQQLTRSSKAAGDQTSRENAMAAQIRDMMADTVFSGSLRPAAAKIKATS